MKIEPHRIALRALDIAPRAKPSSYPEPFASRMGGRTKRAIGDAFGLSSFGANLTVLAPGAQSALLHVHSVSDELVYVLEGTPTLVTDVGERELAPGDCAGFAANGVAHHLVNRSDAPVAYLEIGDRAPEDTGTYPEDDLVATRAGDRWAFTHKDGAPYD